MLESTAFSEIARQPLLARSVLISTAVGYRQSRHSGLPRVGSLRRRGRLEVRSEGNGSSLQLSASLGQETLLEGGHDPVINSIGHDCKCKLTLDLQNGTCILRDLISFVSEERS